MDSHCQYSKNPTTWRETYLHCAAKTGQLKIFESMLESGKVTNPKNCRCEIPFHLACKKGHFKIAELIVKRLAWQNM